MKILVGLLLLALGTAQAATVAIVDSGNDFEHEDLRNKVWVNPIEIPDNDRDEDKNGYPDDINGWNFAEGNNKLIDYSYSWSDTADVRRFFDVQLKSFLGTLTKADAEWANNKLTDPKFIREISVYGNWMHGTHVTGIAAQFSNDVKMLGIKLIPTEVKLPGQDSKTLLVKTGEQVESIDLGDRSKIKDFLVKQALGLLAKQQSAIYGEIGSYINGHKVDVMNGSFGTSYAQIGGVISQLLESILKKKPTDEELKKYTDHFFSVALKESQVFLRSAPKTLFIFAAGNDGSNNDVLPVSPANVVGDNKITVAATLGDQALASFSNYGVKNVEVAAPGVGILSASPLNKHIHVSGTSQAAPYVAGMAGKIKEINSSLDHAAIKRIILETVDVKPWLVGKVSTSGLVNAERAFRAAEHSRTQKDLTIAINRAKKEVLAKLSGEKSMDGMLFQVPNAWVMPLPSQYVVR